MDERYQQIKRNVKADPANEEEIQNFTRICQRLKINDYYCRGCSLFSSDIEPHPCPYALEIYGDSELCNCCPCTEYECAMDI